MELSPQAVRTTGFKTVRKGYDPDEVDSFKERVAAAVEQAQNQSTAMEARARAAVAKLQELTSAGAARQAASGGATPADSPPGAAESTELSATDAENISRTLLLAQRTADSTVAAAKAEADTVTSSAHAEAAGALDAARTTAAKLVADARDEARKASEDERGVAEGEVQALIARRDFLVSDVDHLEQHVEAQRERLREAAANLTNLVERVPGGLGALRRPLLSASDTDGSERRSVPPEPEPDTPPAADEPVEAAGEPDAAAESDTGR